MATPIPDPNPSNGFLNSFAYMADGLGAFLANGLQVDDFVNFSDNAAAVAVDAPQAPGELVDAGGQAIGAVGNAISDAASKAAASTLTVLAPYALVAGLLWVAVETRKGR